MRVLKCITCAVVFGILRITGVNGSDTSSSVEHIRKGGLF